MEKLIKRIPAANKVLTIIAAKRRYYA